MINVEWRDPLEYNRNDYISHYGRKGMKWYQHIFGKEEKDQKSLSETVSSNTNKTIKYCKERPNVTIIVECPKNYQYQEFINYKIIKVLVFIIGLMLI